MSAVVSELLKELQAQKDLLTTQKQILELKSQIAELTKAAEEEAAALETDTGSEDEDGEGAEEGADAEKAAEEALASSASYLAEITAYEVLKAAAKRIGEGLALQDTSTVLVLGDLCLAERCLPLSDLALHHTKKQIDFIRTKVDAQTGVLKGLPNLLAPPPKKAKKPDELKPMGKEDEGEAEKDDEEKPPTAYDVIESWLTGWAGPVKAAGELVKSVGDLLGQLATSFAFQERDVTLPLEALVIATAGAITEGSAQLLALGKIGVRPGSVIDKLGKLMEAVQTLDEQRTRMTTQVVAPLTAETVRRASIIAKLNADKAAQAAEIAATEKRIGELEVKYRHETDKDKKAKLKVAIDLEKAELKRFQKALAAVMKSIAQEQKDLAPINDRLSKASAEVEVAVSLASTFTTFFQGITTAPDKDTLSTLAKAVLREYILGFSHLLRLAIHSGGAEMVTRKLLGFEGRRFVGGCAVSYALVDIQDDRVVKSGLEVAGGQRRFRFSLSEPAQAIAGWIPSLPAPPPDHTGLD
jgi:hypothetical protein